MLAVWRQRKPCRRFVDVSAARRGRQTTNHAVQIEWAHRQLMSASPIYKRSTDVFECARYEGKNHEVLRKSLRAYKPRDICEPGQVLTNKICGKTLSISFEIIQPARLLKAGLWAICSASVSYLFRYLRFLLDQLSQYLYWTDLHEIFSVLTLLVGRQEEHPACKTEWWGVTIRYEMLF